MKISQWNHGVDQLEELAERWGLETVDTARILFDINESKRFWEWHNAEDFLYLYCMKPHYERKRKYVD